MKTWIKLYTEALHDRKMRKMSRFDKSVFYDLLLLSGQEDNGGMLPNIEDIALELDLKLSEAQKSINTLIKVGVITKDTNDKFANVGPNDSCPCGSGKKFKFCHGLRR